MSRSNWRHLAAALCAGIAAVYVLIGLEVVHAGEQVDEAGEAADIRVFGFGAAAIFLVGMALLLAFDRRVLWGIGAVLQAAIIAMYVAVGPDREPSFEAWGLGLRVPQLLLLGILVLLALRPSEREAERVVDPEVAREFLAQHRFAVVGASDEADNFGRTVYGELRDHGDEVVAVHPSAETVMGDPVLRRLADVPGPLDGVIVMVPRAAAVDLVREAPAT